MTPSKKKRVRPNLDIFIKRIHNDICINCKSADIDCITCSIVARKITDELDKVWPKERKLSKNKIIEICNQVADETNTGGKIYIEGCHFKTLAKAFCSAKDIWEEG